MSGNRPITTDAGGSGNDAVRLGIDSLADFQRAMAPLHCCGTARYCSHLEAAFSAIWARHLRAEPPSILRVAPIQLAANR